MNRDEKDARRDDGRRKDDKDEKDDGNAKAETESRNPSKPDEDDDMKPDESHQRNDEAQVDAATTRSQSMKPEKTTCTKADTRFEKAGDDERDETRKHDKTKPTKTDPSVCLPCRFVHPATVSCIQLPSCTSSPRLTRLSDLRANGKTA